MRKEDRVALLVVLTLPVKFLWKLHPHAALPYDQIPEYKLFKYSEITITWPTYISYASEHVIWLMWIYAACMMFPRFKWTFNTWFVIQFLQFGEYFFTYNETQFFAYLFGHKVELGLHLVKLILPSLIFIWELTWREDRL